MSQEGPIDILGTFPEIPTEFIADVGTAVPILNQLELLGDVVAASGIPFQSVASGNTVTYQVQYASAAAATDATIVGLASFDSSMFTVDANGFVQLVGGAIGIDSITGDDAVAVGGDGSGNINFVGSIVANGTNVKPLYFDGDAGTFTQSLELQVATEIAGAPLDSNDAGICSFNNAQFDVDANGFVSLAGGSVAVDSNTGDDSIAVFPDAAGNFNWIGLTVANATHAKPVFFKDSATANAIDLDVQVGAAVTGAPADMNDAGLVSFDDTAFGVNANGFVTLLGGGSAIEQFTLDDTNVVTPTSGNVNMFGQDTPNENGIETYRISANEIGIRMASPFTLENFVFTTATAGTSRSVTVSNIDNTNASSDAAIIASVGGSSGGEAYFSTSKTGTGSWAHGFKAGSSSTYFFSSSTSDSTTPDSGTQIVAINQNGSTTISGQADGSSTNMLMQNVNNTAGSSVNLALQSAGSTAGDAWIRFQVLGATEYSLGIDNSDSDALCLTSTSTLNGTNRLRMTSVGEMTLPFQPAFMAFLGTTDTDATGDGTNLTLGAGNALTEVFDQNGDFVTTGTFTAPVTGRYQLGFNLLLQQMVSGTHVPNCTLVTSNRTYNTTNDATGWTGNNNYQCNVLADMDAADTASVTVSVSGGTKVVDVFGVATNPRSYFYGSLQC